MKVSKSPRILAAAGAGLIFAAFSGAASLAQSPPGTVALSGAKIIPVVGDDIENGVIVIQDGKITAIGKAGEVEIPFDAREFDFTGKVIFPGMIDANTTNGLDVSNESRPIVPQLSAADSLDPSTLGLEDALRNGITTLHVIPGPNTVIGGTGLLIRPIGMNVDEMTVAPAGFLRLSVSPRFGASRMTQMAQLRETFAKLREYAGNLAETKYEEKLKKDEKEMDVGPVDARKKGRELIEADDVDMEHANLLRLIGGSIEIEGEKTKALFKPLGAFIHCQNAMDVPAALRLAEENGFANRTVLTLGGECFKAIDVLKKAARPVVLDGNLIHREVDPFTGDEKETFVPEKIADAGLLFALTTGPSSSLPERMLTYQAARCVRYGIPRSTALKSITINPAKILGVSDQLGSIEVGKSANLVVFSGDPLDFDSHVEVAFIDGIPAYERSKDPRLQRLMSYGKTDATKKASE
ncbi:MAG: amidohydrolase family protein [Phycisphaerae bacterium]